MEPLYSFQNHPATDKWEEYAFERLSSAETEALEEHLLICPGCQTALQRVDEFIRMMKQANWQDRQQPARSWLHDLVYAAATCAAAGGIVAVFLWGEGAIRPRNIAGQAPVELLSLRSGGGGGNHALTGRSMDLRIDLADLPLGRTYRLEIVDAVGRRVWGGEASASIEWLSAYVGKPLKPGRYWVRLYSAEGLAREFSLGVE